MKRFCVATMMILVLSPVVLSQSPPPLQKRPELSALSRDYVNSQLMFTPKSDTSDMDEIAARLSWVLSGNELPPEARDRCIDQNNNPKPDFVGIFKWKQNVTPSKRSLCWGILNLDDAIKEKRTVPALQAQIKALEQRLIALESRK